MTTLIHEPRADDACSLQRLADCAAQGGLSPEGFGLALPVPWPILRRAALPFDPMARVRRLHGLWRGPRRDERRDVALLRVHRVEQAWLLREVMQLVLVGSDPGCALERPVLRWQAWRARARRELALAQSAGFAVARELLVATLWHPSFLGVDGALALARAALGLDPTPEALCGLARARLVARLPAAALAAAERAREECLPGDHQPAELERCRALALDQWICGQ